LRRFLEIALEFKPVNIGDARNGGALRPSRSVNPLAHWKRDTTPNFKGVIEGLKVPTTCAAVFDDRVAAEDFVKRVKEEDFGLSVNISTSIDGAEQCCHHACLARHSVGYSLGFEGKTEKLPNTHVLALSTMCGHGMISHSLANHFLCARNRNFNLDNRGHHLFIQDILADCARRHIGHQRRNGIFFLEAHARASQGPAHLLDFAKPDADTRPPEFNREANFAHLHTPADIIRFHFFRPASFDSRRLMWYPRV
jgi:hypothetical protein